MFVLRNSNKDCENRSLQEILKSLNLKFLILESSFLNLYTISMAFCVFCEIAAGKLPYHLVAQDENFMAILGIFPNTKGMTVVFPKKHYGSYVFHLEDDVIKDLMLFAKKVAKKIDKKLPTVMRTGMVVEGFGVDHAHVKLFPLHGKKTKDWKPIESSKDDYYEEYPGYISSHDSKRADDKELAKLAALLRE